MQVKVGIHEALVDRVKKGQTAIVTLPDFSVDGEVISVASVAKPAGWWTGNMVKYDTVIGIPASQDLEAWYECGNRSCSALSTKNVLLVPVSAVVRDRSIFAVLGKDDHRRN